ncbi:MAG: hypothetical protein H0U91_12160 [Rubrobacter sp.]|nr:hypothetical protein [Rubrobacter sp.]MDQ3363562.1 hypothetical protein [Actinomycetota bacterium]
MPTPGEVISGGRAGRTRPEQVTVYGGVGLAFQDLVAEAVETAMREAGSPLDDSRPLC